MYIGVKMIKKINYEKPILKIHGKLDDITKSGYGGGTDLRDEYGPSGN